MAERRVRCFKCNTALEDSFDLPEPVRPQAWACDHPMHQGAGRADREEFVFRKEDRSFCCRYRRMCNFDICEVCSSVDERLQAKMAESDFRFLYDTCVGTYNALRANPHRRVVLYVDDESDKEREEKPLLHRIWDACAKSDVHVARVKSTEAAVLFLGWFEQLVKRPMSMFRICTDMCRREPADTGERNYQAGLQLLWALILRFDYMGHVMIYTRGWVEAARAVEGLGLVSVTPSVEDVIEFATFQWGAYIEDAFYSKDDLVGDGSCVRLNEKNGVTQVIIERPDPKTHCLAAKVFRQVEAAFMWFVGSSNGKSYYCVDSVSVFLNPKLEVLFKAAMNSLQERPFGFLEHDEKYNDFFGHLECVARQHSRAAEPSSSGPALVWHGTPLHHMRNIVTNGVDLSKVGELGAWHGQGFYTTTFPKYAEKYLEMKNAFCDDGENSLLLCWGVIGKPFPVVDGSQEGKTSAGAPDCTSNYCLTSGYHADERLLEHPNECDGDEVCFFDDTHVLPRYFVKYRPNLPVVDVELSRGLRAVIDVCPHLGENLFSGTRAEFSSRAAHETMLAVETLCERELQCRSECEELTHALSRAEDEQQLLPDELAFLNDHIRILDRKVEELKAGRRHRAGDVVEELTELCQRKVDLLHRIRCALGREDEIRLLCEKAKTALRRCKLETATSESVRRIEEFRARLSSGSVESGEDDSAMCTGIFRREGRRNLDCAANVEFEL